MLDGIFGIVIFYISYYLSLFLDSDILLLRRGVEVLEFAQIESLKKQFWDVQA